MTRRIVTVEYSVDTEHHILSTDLETNRLRGEEYSKAVDTQSNAEQIVSAHFHPALSEYVHKKFSDKLIVFKNGVETDITHRDDADDVWVRFADPELSDEQLLIVEAALRFSIDQVRDNEIRVLDWGDGAVYQLSEQAYKKIDMTGVHVVNEEKMLSETSQLLEDSLSAIQNMKDDARRVS